MRLDTSTLCAVGKSSPSYLRARVLIRDEFARLYGAAGVNGRWERRKEKNLHYARCFGISSPADLLRRYLARQRSDLTGPRRRDSRKKADALKVLLTAGSFFPLFSVPRQFSFFRRCAVRSLMDSTRAEVGKPSSRGAGAARDGFARCPVYGVRGSACTLFRAYRPRLLSVSLGCARKRNYPVRTSRTPHLIRIRRGHANARLRSTSCISVRIRGFLSSTVGDVDYVVSSAFARFYAINGAARIPDYARSIRRDQRLPPLPFSALNRAISGRCVADERRRSLEEERSFPNNLFPVISERGYYKQSRAH